MSNLFGERESGYQLIYVDPPWTYNDKAAAGQRGAGFKYDLMTIEQLKALPIESIAAKQFLIANWLVCPNPPDAL